MIEHPKEPVSIEEKIEYFANEYGVSSEDMTKVLMCESSLNPDAYNGQDKHRTSIGSHGIAQFAESTFNHYSKEAGIENGSPYDVNDALETTAYMFSKDLQFHWTCARKTGVI